MSESGLWSVVVAQKTDDDVKEGNGHFNRECYEDAIECYNKAIEKNPLVAAYFTNRALCCLKLEQWHNVYENCISALNLDSLCIKSHVYISMAFIELRFYDVAMAHLQTADDLTKEKQISYGDHITNQLKRARHLEWEQQQKYKQIRAKQLLLYLEKLMDDDMAENISKIQIPSKGKADTKKYEDSVTIIKKQHKQYTTELNALFAKNFHRLTNREVPDYLCDIISCDIFRDPVITPSGITYDRKYLEEHLMKVGQFDPISRQPLTVNQLIPNLALQEVVKEFAKENEFVNYPCDF